MVVVTALDALITGAGSSAAAASGHEPLLVILGPSVVAAAGAMIAAYIGRGTLREIRRVRKQRRLVLTRLDDGWYLSDEELDELRGDEHGGDE